MMETVRSTRARERRRTVVAAGISVVIHLLLLLLAVVILSLSPGSFFPEEVEDEPVQLTIMPIEPPPVPEERGFVDSSQNEVTEETPENARFESDQNSLAASAAEPVDSSDLPSVAGEESPALALRDQEFTVGPLQPPAPESAPSQPTEPQLEAEPAEEAEPQEEVEEMPEEKPDEVEEPKEVEAEPSPTPPELRENPPELALLDPTLRKPSPRPEPEVRRPEVARPPSPQQPPGYQEQTRTTRLTGGISNRRDLASVEAMATPLGRYKKMLSDAIGSRWNYYVRDMIDLVTIGTVEVRFVVRQDGTVEGVRVLTNSSNESLASCSVRSVVEAEIPPIPEEVVRELDGGRIEVDYSFTILGR